MLAMPSASERGMAIRATEMPDMISLLRENFSAPGRNNSNDFGRKRCQPEARLIDFAEVLKVPNMIIP
jgi:hypothetical protein